MPPLTGVCEPYGPRVTWYCIAAAPPRSLSLWRVYTPLSRVGPGGIACSPQTASGNIVHPVEPCLKLPRMLVAALRPSPSPPYLSWQASQQRPTYWLATSYTLRRPKNARHAAHIQPASCRPPPPGIRTTVHQQRRARSHRQQYATHDTSLRTHLPPRFSMMKQ
ncbi:MAG TPA: hypothetical protein VEL31_02280 [Ktedonobacteraceae bacterium]|nr:hypothetical protein [Ktedonobacteraceae bacterium]